MANNTTITPGSGITVATDDVSAVHYQVVKLAVGTEDSAVRIGHREDDAHTSLDGGIMALAVRADTAAATAANSDYTPILTNNLGEAYTQSVGQYAKILLNPTVDTAIYAAADIVGGIQTIANWARVTAGAARLRGITTWTEDGEIFQYTILFFSATPSGGTYADQGPATWAAGDFGTFLGKVTVVTADYVTLGGDGVAFTAADMPLPVAATSLFALIFATATPTFAATTDLNIAFLVQY